MANFNFARVNVQAGGLPLQRRLVVGAVDDPAEVDADTVAGSVLGTSTACEEESDHAAKLLRRKASGSKSLAVNQHAPPLVLEALRSPGQQLVAKVRADMEGRFSHDFSRVRIHQDSVAAPLGRLTVARGAKRLTKSC